MELVIYRVDQRDQRDQRDHHTLFNVPVGTRRENWCREEVHELASSSSRFLHCTRVLYDERIYHQSRLRFLGYDGRTRVQQPVPSCPSSLSRTLYTSLLSFSGAHRSHIDHLLYSRNNSDTPSNTYGSGRGCSQRESSSSCAPQRRNASTNDSVPIDIDRSRISFGGVCVHRPPPSTLSLQWRSSLSLRPRILMYHLAQSA
jgi:hypothetical protein